MQIDKRMQGTATVIALSGKFDITSTPHFEETFAGFIKSQPKPVAFDMIALQYIDSSGIGAMIKALNFVRGYGGEIIVFGTRPEILTVFKLARLDNFFKMMSPDDFVKQYPG